MGQRIIDIFVWTGIGLVIGMVWWQFYVIPQSKIRNSIIECMASKHDPAQWSRELYSECREHAASQELK